MDGLSVLFGILTVLFLAVVLGMNILGTTGAPKIKGLELDQEGFQDTTPQAPTLGTKVKKVLDPLALYTSPDGKPIPEGKDLCDVFTQVRNALAQNIKGTESVSDAELMKKVEAQLAIDIPGGALPCPLLQYPADTATDLYWLTWVQSIPTDFGARVVFMASYADDKLTSVAKSMKDALAGDIELPELPKEGFASGIRLSEGFLDTAICTPMLAEKKQKDQEAASCIDPKTLSPQQIEAEVMKLLQTLVSEKERILKSIPLKDRTAIIKDPIQSIRSAKVAAGYLNTQKQKAEAGTLTPTGTNPKLV
jgi:hypothetical protein